MRRKGIFRDQKHRMNNILGKAPREVRDLLRDEIVKAFYAERYEQGLTIARDVIERLKDHFPAAMECLAEDLEACIQCLKLPPDHHKRVRHEPFGAALRREPASSESDPTLLRGEGRLEVGLLASGQSFRHAAGQRNDPDRLERR